MVLKTARLEEKKRLGSNIFVTSSVVIVNSVCAWFWWREVDMSSSSSSSVSSSSDENDLGFSDSEEEEGNEFGLAPFMFEPERTEEEVRELLKNLSLSEATAGAEKRRAGNINWCSCGKKCKAMTTEEESLCCRDTNDIPDNHFSGTLFYFEIYMYIYSSFGL